MYYFVISRTKHGSIKIVEDGIGTKKEAFDKLLFWKDKYSHVAITNMIQLEEDLFYELESSKVFDDEIDLLKD